MSQDVLMAHEALILRLRLELHLVSLEEIEFWADAWLQAFENPSYELVELSFMKTSAEGPGILLQKLGGEKKATLDVVEALAVSNTDTFGRFDFEILFQDIFLLSVSLDDATPEGRLLGDAIDLWGVPPGVSMETYRGLVKEYFGKARQLVAAAASVPA